MSIPVMISRYLLIVLIGALLWGGSIAATGFELGAAAWSAGALIGLCVRATTPPKGHGWTLAVTLGASAAVLAKLLFVLMVPEAARPPLWAAFHPIDLLWLAMVVSATHWMLSLPSRRRRSWPFTLPDGTESPSPARSCPPRVRPADERVSYEPKWQRRAEVSAALESKTSERA